MVVGLRKMLLGLCLIPNSGWLGVADSHGFERTSCNPPMGLRRSQLICGPSGVKCIQYKYRVLLTARY